MENQNMEASNFVSVSVHMFAKQLRELYSCPAADFGRNQVNHTLAGFVQVASSYTFNWLVGHNLN